MREPLRGASRQSKSITRRFVVEGVPAAQSWTLLHMLSKSWLLVALIICSGAALAQPPQNFVATYKAKYGGIPITATRELKTLDDGSMVFSFVAKSWIASIEESSRFRWADDNHIVPQHYTYNRSGLGRDRTAELSFDWDNGKVTNDVQDKPWVMTVPPLALDKLSYQLQIRTDLINDKPLLEYNIADGGHLKQYNFEILGEERLKTKVGTFDTIKVRRIREDEDNRHTIFWMAKNWDHLVIRMQQEEDGKSYEIDLTEATLDGVKVKGE